MKPLKRLGAALFALTVATVAAHAAGFSIQSPSIRGPSAGLRPDVSISIDRPDHYVPIEIQEERGIALRFDESPVDISGHRDRPSLQTRMFEPEAVLRCKIDADSADSLIVANVGSDPVLAGTTIKWQVRASGERGFFALSKDLSAGQSVRAREVLSGDAENGGKCSAKAV